MGIQPIDFIKKWKAITQTERAVSHSHFIDLCNLLGEESPTDVDHDGSKYCFERGAIKTTGKPGWADVWKRRCFGWEYKKKRRNLAEAFSQFQQYAIALENPPLLIVSDIDRIEVHTNWTNSVSAVHEFLLDDLLDADARNRLKCAWSDSGLEVFKPGKTRAELTKDAVAKFATLAEQLRSRGAYGAESVAHFIHRLVFCRFAEDAGLLPGNIFKRMLDQANRRPEDFVSLSKNLFRAMAMRDGGLVGIDRVDWFNGGLFDDDTALSLEPADIALVREVAHLSWKDIDTSIFGTLFERGLDPSKGSQIGAHYTDQDKIEKIIDPVIRRPLLAEWEDVKSTMSSMIDMSARARRRRSRAGQDNLGVATYRAFLERLRNFKVLDPACGSGNFLYLALLGLKDIEHIVTIEAEAFGIARDERPRIGPEAVMGIERNLYAAELARMTVWIGEIQWMRRNGFDVPKDPILRPLDNIECRDAVLDIASGTEPQWPHADVIVGNPPYLGAKK